VVWTIAGLDNSGGAGLLADVKTFHDFNVYACALSTAVTAQNTSSVMAVEAVSDEMFHQQLLSLENEFTPRAIKSGMLASPGQVRALSAFLQRYPDIFYVLDPVIIASSGDRLCTDLTLQAMRAELFPKADLITPNLYEAQNLARNLKLTGSVLATAVLESTGSKAVLLKGGHSVGCDAVDFYCGQNAQSFSLSLPRVNNTNSSYHGSGCHLSAAITAALAEGHSVENAVFIAKDHIQTMIKQALDFGGKQGILHSASDEKFHLAKYRHAMVKRARPAFKKLALPIGFYPIVDSLAWVKSCLSWGVTTLQLRIKDLTQARQTIPLACQLASDAGAQLFINDHWQLAIQYGAYGLHLGQQDLLTADLDAIQLADLRLGISTHDYHELGCALSWQPSYIALGPIFPTQTKKMPFAPQGLSRIKEWKSLIAGIPLVAIGGLDDSHMRECYHLGADGVAVVNYLKYAKMPREACRRSLVLSLHQNYCSAVT